jgi:hypothetical protein
MSTVSFPSGAILLLWKWVERLSRPIGQMKHEPIPVQLRIRLISVELLIMSATYALFSCYWATFSAAPSPARAFGLVMLAILSGCASIAIRTSWGRMVFRVLQLAIAVELVVRERGYSLQDASVEFALAHLNTCIGLLATSCSLLPLKENLLTVTFVIVETLLLPYFSLVSAQIADAILFSVLVATAGVVGLVVLLHLTTKYLTELRERTELARIRESELSALKSQFVAVCCLLLIDIALTRCVQTISHEIRTPMNGVLSLLRPLLDSTLTAEQRMWIENIQTSGRVLLAVANQVRHDARASPLALAHDSSVCRCWICRGWRRASSRWTSATLTCTRCSTTWCRCVRLRRRPGSTSCAAWPPMSRPPCAATPCACSRSSSTCWPMRSSLPVRALVSAAPDPVLT